MHNATHKTVSTSAKKPKCMYAALIKLINSLSPLVVAIGKNPFFSRVGDFISKIVMKISMHPITLKNVAVTPVQAIQFIVLILNFVIHDQGQNPSQHDYAQTK